MLPNSDLHSSEASRSADRERDSTASGASGGASGGTFRKFRHLLMAKQLESRGDTHLAEVLPNTLFVGSFGAAGNRSELERMGVTHVVCVSETLPLLFPELVEYLRLSVADVPTACISESFPTAFAFIDRALASGGKVLVHCYLGRSRSVTIVLAYLVARKRMALADATTRLRRVRPQMEPNSGFWRALTDLEQQQQRSGPSFAPESAEFSTMEVEAPLAVDEDDYDGTLGDRDLILSREDFAMLHALHRFVPLPALSSNILRILCDDDLQVPADGNDSDDDSAGACQSEQRSVGVSRGSSHSLLRSASVAASVPKHSPLTRRLSKYKPRVAINLSTVSPQSRPQQQLDRVVSRKTSNNNDTNSSHEDDREG